jgi:hypothetical protein
MRLSETASKFLNLFEMDETPTAGRKRVQASKLNVGHRVPPTKLQEFRGTGKDNFEAPERRYRRDIKVGDKVKGIMGVHGRSSGTVTKIGSPYSSSGSPTIFVKSDDGKEWDTFGFNLSLDPSETHYSSTSANESKLTECDHGDIVRLTGYLKRPGYYKVDTQNAVGASQERPWVENLSDPGTGFYIDPSDVGDMELVVSSEEHDTGMINTFDDVENILAFGDVEYDDDFEHDDD